MLVRFSGNASFMFIRTKCYNKTFHIPYFMDCYTNTNISMKYQTIDCHWYYKYIYTNDFEGEC